MGSIPAYEHDLFTDSAILEPYDHYRALRALGPVAWLPHQQCYAVSRYADVHAVLADATRFVSGKGISLNETMNGIPTSSVITSDGEQHSFRRKLEMEPLGPKALGELRARIFDTARLLIDHLLAAPDARHDAVADIARHLPLTVVMELGGLPPVGRDQVLRWAAAVFDLQGPMNARGEAAMPALQDMLAYVMRDIDRTTVAPGSWAARAFQLADEGVIAQEMVADLLIDFIAPSLDTTIAATGNLLMLLGQNPDQWRLLKRERGKIPNAINESLRVESPIRCFSRLAAEDVEIDGVAVPAGARIAIFYAAANRDEQRFEEPDRFDITRRNATDQLAFGTGKHQCLGANLARLEMTAILTALLDRVDRIEVGEPVFALNNLLRTLASLPIRTIADGATHAEEGVAA